MDIPTTTATARGYTTYPIVGLGEQEETVHYAVGTANIDVVDAHKKLLVWVGIAEGRLTEAMINSPDDSIAKIVSDMFAKYPAKAANEWMPAPSARGRGRRKPIASPRGEEITAANGMKVKLSRPLDFIVVADHSDNFGFFPKLFAGRSRLPGGSRPASAGTS